MQNSSEFQYIAIDTIHESATNPRRTFDEYKLGELADFVPGNKIGILCRSPFCCRGRQKRTDADRPRSKGYITDERYPIAT